MSDRAWKQFERRIARLPGTRRIPVTGERAGADVETPLLAAQVKKRATVPGYLFAWLDGIRAAAERSGKVGLVECSGPAGRTSTRSWCCRCATGLISTGRCRTCGRCRRDAG